LTLIFLYISTKNKSQKLTILFKLWTNKNHWSLQFVFSLLQRHRILNTNLFNQSIFKESSRFIFQNLFGRYQHLVEKYYVPGFVTRLTRRVSRVEQELRTLPGHLSSPPIFSGVRVTRSLVLYVCFVNRCLFFFFWPLCCLSFFDIQILITPLVSSNSSCPFVLFLLLIVLSVLLRYTDADCVDYCFTIISYDGLVYYLIFKWWLTPSTLFNENNIIHMTNSVSRRLNITAWNIIFCLPFQFTKSRLEVHL
jgi:hypothetical protein